MTITFTKFHQVGASSPTYLLFEKELMDLGHLIGRPLPGLKGGEVPRQLPGQMPWLVVCTLRGGVVPQLSEQIDIDIMDDTWINGAIQAMQGAIARLAYYHQEQLISTPFRYYGKRNHARFPTSVEYHP